MFDLILAAMLAQTTPAPDVTPLANTSPASADMGGASAMPAPAGVTFPRGPRRNEMPALLPGDVMIRNGGSTNTAGYTIVIHKDFSADVDGIKKTVGRPQAKWLLAKLDAGKPLGQMGSMHCMKSASFGSVTTITYDGETTPDLSCGGGPQVQELERTIGVIVNQLGVDTRRSPRMMRM